MASAPQSRSSSADGSVAQIQVSTRHVNIRQTDRLLASAQLLLANRDQTASSQEEILTMVGSLIHAATHDELTGLPTRSVLHTTLEQRIAHSLDTGEQVAILFLDLDNFKLVNDSMGHHTGDELLCQVAQRISDCVSECLGAMVSRIGGDEFIVLHPSSTVDTTSLLISRLLNAISKPVHIDGMEIVTSASVGAAFSKSCSSSAEQLIQNADTALYAAKARGRNRMVWFDEELQLRASRRFLIESDLRVALREEQLFVHYQPQVSLLTGQLVGVEALARWTHPEHGAVSPAEFIPVAEEGRLIVELGRQILLSACKQLAAWTAESPDNPLFMTVNVSPRQLADPLFIKQVESIAAQTGVELSSLCLELTEGALSASNTEVIAALDRLHAMGIYVAIDDFGTEYSSLARLRDLPIEVLKIDRSFVDGDLAPGIRIP